MTGWARFDDGNINKVPPGYLPLVFWIRPFEGVPYKVDLTDMCGDIPSQREHASVGPIEGRYAFTHGFALSLCRERTGLSSYNAKRHALRIFFRFLEDDDPEGNCLAPDFVTDDMGIRLQSWLERRQSPEYGQIRTVVAQIRAAAPPLLSSMPMPLLWPSADLPKVGAQKDIGLKAVQKLNMAFVKEAMDIKAMFREGDRLAAAGIDPRTFPSDPSIPEWRSVENHAWLARAILSEGTLGDREYSSLFVGPTHGPTYLAPGMKEVLGQSLGRKLRWFTFGRRDAMVFLWIFLLKTGWNLGTAFRLDVRDERRWCHVDRLSPRHRILRAYKPRAGRIQYATSLEEPEWFPYQIVRFVAERTEPLRAIVKRRLAASRRVQASMDGLASELERHIAELEADLRSPWLYVTTRGDVGRLRPDDGGDMNEVARFVEEKLKREELQRLFAGHDARGRGPVSGPVVIENWVTSDARDARIRHAYESDGFDAIVAQAAGQHARIRTSKHYLGAASLDEAGERRFRAMQAAIFSDLGEGRPLDAVRLKILVRNETITPEQEARLLDLRMRTKVGMGCLDHQNPPHWIAPKHPSGEACAVQRCACCPHGVVFDDSLDELARRAVELRSIQETVSIEAWTGSSFEAEIDAIDATLETFDPGMVQAAKERWRTRFENGDAVVRDTFPDYGHA